MSGDPDKGTEIPDEPPDGYVTHLVTGDILSTLRIRHFAMEQAQSPPERLSPLPVSSRLEPEIRRRVNETDEVGLPTFSTLPHQGQ